jgi:AcrR family transcriptional regulator
MSVYLSSGRMNQKRRTRQALVIAAAGLVQRGETPTVAEVAEAAQVAKSTAYRYFPTQELLLATARLEAANGPEVAAVYAAAGMSGPAAARLDAVVRADHALVTRHEAAFRAFLRATLAPRGDTADDLPRRPGNRLRYLAGALDPLRDELGTERLERLVLALAMCVGLESLVVLVDIGGVTPDEAEAVKRWAAAALLHRALAEARGEPASGDGRLAGA